MFEASASTTFFQLPLTLTLRLLLRSYVTQLSSRDIVNRGDATQQLTLQKPVKKSDELGNQIVSVEFKNELCDVCEVETEHH